MKATHKGECQICGAVQKLPGGVLSNHGYTVKWGFFSGICRGAGHLPFEVSKDQIASAVASVEKTISEVSAQIADLENIDSEINGSSDAWFRVYNGCYVWERVPVLNFDASRQYGDRTAYSASVKIVESRRNNSAEQVRPIEAYEVRWNLSSVRHWVHFLNCKYAGHLREINSSRRDWVNWQQGRMVNWTPQPLKPL